MAHTASWEGIQYTTISTIYQPSLTIYFPATLHHPSRSFSRFPFHLILLPLPFVLLLHRSNIKSLNTAPKQMLKNGIMMTTEDRRGMSYCSYHLISSLTYRPSPPLLPHSALFSPLTFLLLHPSLWSIKIITRS